MFQTHSTRFEPQTHSRKAHLVKSKWQRIRWIIYLAIVGSIAAWKFIPRPWNPRQTLNTPHFTIQSTATESQTAEVAEVAEVLYRAYSNEFHALPAFEHNHHLLRIKLYKNRDQLRWVNPNMGWAEAFYRKPYCHAYYSEHELNSVHWMLHEVVHQLNEEVARVNPARWLEEGIAEYFSTSRIVNGELQMGRIDPNTYPVWWIEEMATTPNLATNIANGSVIPLAAILNNRNGPAMRTHFNLYYLHWWTLTHYIMTEHRPAMPRLLADGADLKSFEQHIGKVAEVQHRWHEHVRRMRESLGGERDTANSILRSGPMLQQQAIQRVIGLKGEDPVRDLVQRQAGGFKPI